MRPSKRELVLDAAERLFYEEGFHATGVDRVVAEASVARMTLYNHFPSKETLIEAVLSRRYARYLDDLRDAIEARAEGSAVMALAARHAAWLRTESRHGCIVLKAIGEFEHHQASIADLGRRLKRGLLGVIADAVAIDGHPADAGVTERLLVVFEGADALVPVLGPEPAARQLHALVDAIAGGVDARPA